MPARFRWFLVLVLLALPAFAAGAERVAGDAVAPPSVTPDADDRPGQTVFTPTRAALRDPFSARVRELGARRDAALAELRARMAAASPEARPAIQREVEAVKQAWAAELTGAQLDRARATGRVALAARLERRLAVLRDGAGAARRVPEGGAR